MENKTYSIKLHPRKEITISSEDIDDICAAALEGGIVYWCESAEVVEDEYYGEYASEQISRGGSLELCDNEEHEGYVLTLEKLLCGIETAFAQGYGEMWFDGDRIDTTMIDGEAADIIVQCALFDEVMFG